MNCKDFCEIADTYLSDELAVETNHDFLRHLESCADCRNELAFRRELRGRLRDSFRDSAEFQINPGFSARLNADLRADAFRKSSRFSWRVLTPVLAGILVVAGLFAVTMFRNDQVGFAAELSKKAFNRHTDCGLKHIKEWEAEAANVVPEKAAFVKPLANDDTEILEVHECEFAGKRFTHYVLRRNEKVISVLKTATESQLSSNSNSEDTIVCEKTKGFQMASFRLGGEMVFVVSDLSEAENLNVARTLSNTFHREA